MKQLTDYQAIIADMDGTLYYQKPVRAAMLKEMLFSFWRFPEFLIVKKYRKLYAAGLKESDRFSVLPAKAPQVIREWMIERPLPYVKRYRDAQLIALLQRAQKKGIQVIVCSDYPITEKLGCLNLAADISCDAENMGCLKPDATGLVRILNANGVSPQACIVIGDLYEKDGKLAENLGADHLILPASRKERIKIYKAWENDPDG